MNFFKFFTKYKIMFVQFIKKFKFVNNNIHFYGTL